MKSTGIVRKIDELGRLVMPSELRNTLDMPSGTPIEFYVENEKVILKKYEPGCIFCGGTEVKIYEGKMICSKCIDKIKEI